LQLALVAMACSLCATAMAQQKPLTGHMLDGRTATPAAETAPQAPPPPPSNHVTRQPATTYPAAPARQARTATAADDTASSPAQTQTAQTAQAPMPAYTDMKTAYIQPPPTTDETRSLPFGTPVGDVTHYLLRMQASNQNAVASLPTLGDEASAAYKRYLQSFNHPIPDFFKTMVKTNSGSGSSQ